MAQREVFNQATGERFWFDDADCTADGRVRRLRYELAPGKTVPRHWHPGTAQRFEVVSGRLHIEADGNTQVLDPGAGFACRPGAPHTQWNEGPGNVVAEEFYEPPLAIEGFFTGLATMADRGEVRPGGAPRNLLQFAAFVHANRDVVRIANPALARVIPVLGAVGRMLGYHRVSTPPR